MFSVTFMPHQRAIKRQGKDGHFYERFGRDSEGGIPLDISDHFRIHRRLSLVNVMLTYRIKCLRPSQDTLKKKV